jgi:hypothetical protein
MKPKFIFHIGLEKTGTDSFQRFCKDNYRTLLDSGVLYPIRGLAFAANSHGPLVNGYLPYPDFSIGPAHRKRPEILRSLFKEIEKAAPDTVLISAEHFSSRFRDEQIRELAADFAGYDCRIAVVVRTHSARIFSAYSQTVVSGRSLTLDEFCDEIFEPGNRYARYKETVIPWENTFGQENVRIFSHGSGANIVESLCEALIPGVAPKLEPSSYWDNKSLGANSVETLRQVNGALATREAQHLVVHNFVKWALLRHVRLRVLKLITKAAAGQPRNRMRLSENNLRRLKEITDIDYPWLESRGIHLTEPNVEASPPQDATQAMAAELLAQALVKRIRWWPSFLLLKAMR